VSDRSDSSGTLLIVLGAGAVLLGLACLGVVGLALVGGFVWRGASPPPMARPAAPMPTTAPPPPGDGTKEIREAPKGDAIADPDLREARAAADATLDGLLAGKFDDDEALRAVARKVKGFTSATVTDQKTSREDGLEVADFWGFVGGPRGFTPFQMRLVKQANGKWAVGWFRGPDLQ
jgi:hypothetical protein